MDREARQTGREGKTLSSHTSLPSVCETDNSILSLKSSSHLQHKVKCSGNQGVLPFSGEGGLP